MNLVLLTTDTPHHLHWAARLAVRHRLCAVFLESMNIGSPPDAFEQRRLDYERETLRSGTDRSWRDLAPVHEVGSLNDSGSIAALTDVRPDVTLVFGTGKLGPAVLSAGSPVCLNLHGGNPEHYRGLDTHLWAVYHREFDQLVTTLHTVDDGLDTGRIVFQAEVPLVRDMPLHCLRSANTGVCVDLSLLALESLRLSGRVPSRAQVTRGRYYSVMPASLRDLCVRRFGRHVAAL